MSLELDRNGRRPTSDRRRQSSARYAGVSSTSGVMRETLDGFQDGLKIGGRMITNLRYADDSILLATSEAELQELVDRLDRVSRKYRLLINVDKTKVMASDGIA